MKLNFKAFTTYYNGVAREIKNEVHVFISKNFSEKFNLKYKGIQYSAVWDTGATRTAIHPKIAKELKLIPIGKQIIHAAKSSYDSPVYLIDLGLPNGVLISDLQVTEAPNLLHCDVLIGMDVICLGDFCITNASGKTWISFRIPPDYKHINYVDEFKRGQKSQKMVKKYKKKLK